MSTYDLETLILLTVTAVCTVLLVVFGLPPFLGWLRGASHRRSRSGEILLRHADQPHPPRPESGYHARMTQTVSVRSVEGGRDPIGSGAATLPVSAPVTQARPRTRNQVILIDEVLVVGATEFAEVHRDVEGGATVKIFAREEDGQTFDFYMIDRRNFARFCRDRGGRELVSRLDEPVIDLEKRVPTTGTWYFVIDTYGKQNDRRVQLEVRYIPED
jgi:hypothetical protein